MREYKRTIPNEEVKIMERLDFQIKGREFIITKMLSNGTNFDNELFKKYHDEYIDYFTQFEIAKNMINEKYIPEQLNKVNNNWSLNYSNHTLTVLADCDEEVEDFN